MAGKNDDPYEILEAANVSNDFQLRVAFRKKIHQYKVDRLKPTANRTISDQQFRLICRAYETLSDYDKRKIYKETQQWTSNLDESEYTFQQLAAEPCLAAKLKQKLAKAKLSEIDPQDENTRQTPLYCAARTGNVEAVQYLIEQGADPDLRQRTSSTALHAASFFGHPEIVRCLLESGANYTLTNTSNNTPDSESFNEEVKRIFNELIQTLFVQVAANQLDWIKENISNIKDHIDTQYYAQRQTLLHCASKKGHFDLVKWLLEQRSANIDIVDVNLNSALHLAAYGGYESVVKYLLEQGADSTLLNKWGMTAEQEGKRHKNSISKLFQSMNDMNMFEMAVAGKFWWFKYHFGDNSTNAVDGQGSSILYVACRFGQTAIAQWLLDHGANINTQLPAIGSTPLHAAVFRNHKSTIELLLSRGADLSIRNRHGNTPFDEVQSDDVKQLLKQYRDDLAEEKYLIVHLYGDGAKSGNQPIAKVQLHCEATIDDLIKATAKCLTGNYRWFSVARSPLNADSNKISVVSAVCRARHVNMKFVDLPLSLIAYATPRYINSGYEFRKEFPSYNSREFDGKFQTQNKKTSFIVDKSNSPQIINVENLIFTFAPNCVDVSISINIKYILKPNKTDFGLPECVCLFRAECGNKDDKLNEMATVEVKNEGKVKLYTWITNTGHWFSYSDQPTRLPYIGGLYALIRDIEIIPNHLYLPPEMFIQNALGSLLEPRQTPIPCQYLKIRDPDTTKFAEIAYHGTSIGVIRSILMDGLVMANTVVSTGFRVCPPAGHIARGVEAFGIPDFANGLFVSPSVHYSSDPVYAVPFTWKDQSAIAVLECRIKSSSFTKHKSTVSSYIPKPGDDINAIEWRLVFPAYIQITGVLFIPLIKSISEATKLRMAKVS